MQLHIIYVDNEAFDRSKTKEIAYEVSQLNSEMLEKGKQYLLIGFGRWGTLDPWLGIPVTWSQIAGAKAIIEADGENWNDYMKELEKSYNEFFKM